ncbi:MAG: type IV pilin N-terminal domain-containing protein [Thaumarchaeota archaeon]|nr:type IV pilin N-terminal domain-containing protein [Nitrososphaerota archaeon]
MDIRRYTRKRAISPVLATVILIAITLVAAVAIATFVFGLFGTSISGPTLSIISSSVACNGGTGSGTCAMTVHNAGASAGTILTAGPTQTFNFNGSEPFTVPANGNILVNMTYAGTGQATGYLTQSNGPNLVFSVTLS